MQQEDTPTALDTPTNSPPHWHAIHTDKLQFRFIKGITPKNHNKDVIYNNKGNPREHTHIPPTPSPTPNGTQYYSKR